MVIVPVLLAAGGGSRFTAAGHKLLADLHGEPVYRHALRHVVDAAVGPVVVVTGAAALELPEDVTAVANPRWAQGQAGSLQLAVAAATDLGADAVLVGLADQPFVPPAAWRAVAAAPPAWRVVVASYAGVRGPNPVRLHRSVWASLPTSGDEGARSLVRDDPGAVHDVPCPGSPADIDTVEDLQRWTSS